MGGDRYEPVLAPAGRGAGGQRARPAQTVQGLVVRQSDDGGSHARDLLGEALDVAPGSEADDLQTLGMRGHDRERAATDRAGGAEDGDPLHGRRAPTKITTV